MTNYICTTCGTQFQDSPEAPKHCPICEDERQYIGPGGQHWTTMDTLARDHANVFRLIEPGLTGIATEPKVAIGQRALIVEGPKGNVMWDCISYIDQPTIDTVNAMGGITAIAISHPHFYSSMIAWSRAFGNVPIYLHESNRTYVMRPELEVVFWDGETYELQDGITLARCGGHFEGSTILHWAAGAEGRGAIFTGDTIQVVQDRRFVSFMYSYPNLIPMNAASVQRIVAAVEPYNFDRIYGGWWEAVVAVGGKRSVEASASRYIERISPGGGSV